MREIGKVEEIKSRSEEMSRQLVPPWNTAMALITPTHAAQLLFSKLMSFKLSVTYALGRDFFVSATSRDMHGREV